MRKYLIFIAVAFLALSIADKAMASTALEGVILQDRPGGPPLPGVVVSAPGAKQSFTTTKFGRFLLEFPQKHPGDAVLLTCAREGMEVVNVMDLEARLGSKLAETAVKLYMCKQGERDVHAANYYRIEIRRTIEGNFQNEVERIKNVHQKDIDLKNAEIARLHQEKEKVLALSDDWAKKFAAVRLNTASELYKEAYRLFQTGDIDRAIAVLDDAKLKEARRIAKAEIEKSVETHMLKARLLIMKFRFDEAEKYFRIAVDDAPWNFENIFEFAVYLQNQNKHPTALELYKDALYLADKSGNYDAIAATLNNLGLLQTDLNDYPAAKKNYKRALEIYVKLAEETPNTYLPDVAMTQNNLGTFYSDLNDYPEAKKAYKRALEIYKNLSEENPNTYLPDVAMTQNNLGIFYSDLNDYPAAEKASKRALEIYKKLAEESPNTYLPDVAATHNNLGLFCKNLNGYPAAEKAYKKAFKIYEKLAGKNPNTYLPYVAMTQNNLGNFYSDLNDYPAAEKAYKRAFDIFEKLAEENPNTYLPNVAAIQNNLGGFYKNLNNYPEAEKAYNRALEIREKLAKENPDNYFPDLAMTQYNLGLLFHSRKENMKAESAYERALAIREKLAASNPRVHELHLCTTLLSIGYLQMEFMSQDPLEKYREKGVLIAGRAIDILKKYEDIPKARKYRQIAEKLKTSLETFPTGN